MGVMKKLVIGGAAVAAVGGAIITFPAWGTAIAGAAAAGGAVAAAWGTSALAAAKAIAATKLIGGITIGMLVTGAGALGTLGAAWYIGASKMEAAREEGRKLGQQEISREYEKKLRDQAVDFFEKVAVFKKDMDDYRQQRDSALSLAEKNEKIAKENEELAAEAIKLSEALQSQIDGWEAKGGKAEKETQGMLINLQKFISKQIKKIAS